MNYVPYFTIICAFLLSCPVAGQAQPAGTGCHGDSTGQHGGYHYPGDSLTAVTATGKVMIDQDTLHHMDRFFLDTDNDGLADYWLHFGPNWYAPDSLSRPVDGTQITVAGGLLSHTTPPGILVTVLDGKQWIDTTGSYEDWHHHGADFGCDDSTHLHYDTLQQISRSGTFLHIPDTLFHHDEYYLDVDNDGVADYWLHLGPPGYVPAGRTLPRHGSAISVSGGLMPRSSTPGIFVLTLNGILWRDSTWTGGHGGGWVGRRGGHIGTANGSWCSFPDSSFGRRMGGGHMGEMRWSDSVYCVIDTTLPPHWNGQPAVAYSFQVRGSDGRMRMGHGGNGMMQFNLSVELSLRYAEGFFADESSLRLWRSDGGPWTVVENATINTATNSIRTEQNPLYEYYVIAPSAPTGITGPASGTTFALTESFPNPFRTTMNIHFRVDARMHVRIGVYDIRGRLLHTVVRGERDRGTHMVQLKAATLPTGTYMLVMETARGRSARPVHIVR
ncbi:MAG: T9SS type A sorting domain-containing protein [Bacteroidota bacterium]|nr:T9SS type A sorting domain-containing protein [Bacteroidota bacterium]